MTFNAMISPFSISTYLQCHDQLTDTTNSGDFVVPQQLVMQSGEREKKTHPQRVFALGILMLNPPTTPPPAFACERTRIDRWFQLRCATTDGIVGLLILKSRCCSVNLRIQCEKCRNKTGFVHEHSYVTECVFFQLVYPALFWAWPGKWCSRGWDAGVVR